MQTTSPYVHSKRFRVLWSKGLFEVMEIFSILMFVVFTWLKTFVKIHTTLNLNKSGIKTLSKCSLHLENILFSFWETYFLK